MGAFGGSVGPVRRIRLWSPVDWPVSDGLKYRNQLTARSVSALGVVEDGEFFFLETVDAMCAYFVEDAIDFGLAGTLCFR